MKQSYPNEILAADRITLRRVDPKYYKVAFEVIEENREYLDEFLPWVEGLKSVEDELKSLELIYQRWTEYKIFDYMIFLNSNNTYIGNIGGHHIEWNNKLIEYGYWVAKNYQGNGYITEAAGAIEQEFFRLGFHRLEIRCSDFNIKSSKIPERLNYTFEGLLRENQIFQGKFRNTKVYSKLATDE